MHKLEGNHVTFKFILVLFTSEMPYINNSFRRDMVQTCNWVSFKKTKTTKFKYIIQDVKLCETKHNASYACRMHSHFFFL